MYVNLIVNSHDAWVKYQEDMGYILANTVTRVSAKEIAEDLFDICWHQAAMGLAYLDDSIPPMELLDSEISHTLLSDLMYNDIYEYLIETEYLAPPPDVPSWMISDIDEIVTRTIALAHELINIVAHALRASNAAPSFFDPNPLSKRVLVTQAVPHVLVGRPKDYVITCELMIPNFR